MKLFIVLSVLVVAASAKVFTQCGLAQELVSQGLPRAQIENWVCLVESESSRNTAAIGGPNSNGSKDYGLFQINNNYWCKNGAKGNDCNVACESLIDDDITDDVACAKIIYARHGFTAWNGWKAKCQGALPNVNACFTRQSVKQQLLNLV